MKAASSSRAKKREGGRAFGNARPPSRRRNLSPSGSLDCRRLDGLILGLKDKPFAFGGHGGSAASLDRALQQLLGKRVLEILLDRAAHRARTVGGIEAFL